MRLLLSLYLLVAVSWAILDTVDEACPVKKGNTTAMAMADTATMDADEQCMHHVLMAMVVVTGMDMVAMAVTAMEVTDTKNSK
ncbi:unnamed protein product [Strongylus vulgaris]|uniref:Uncharacterized protein n=1 Tax=Strongylus vulgaris TaxID=40348 RepID=A0A3P7J1F0_STRVU|nr:unnamed protein product [Strongylus vulgaris]